MAYSSPITSTHNWFVGEDKILQWTIYQTTALSSPQNLAGYTMQFLLARHYEDTPLLTKSVTIVTSTAGTCRATIADTDTSTMAPKTYVYSLWRTNDGSEQVLAFGQAVLKEAVST